MTKSIVPQLTEDIIQSQRVVDGAIASGVPLGLKTTFELGDQIAKRLFDSRSKAKGQRNVEVHLTEGELRDLLAGAAELARVGYVPAAFPDVDVVAAMAHQVWVDVKRSEGHESRRSEDGEEQMVPFAQLSTRAKTQPRRVVEAIYAILRGKPVHQTVFVEVFEFASGKAIAAYGPMPYAKACKLEDGLNINMDHEKYGTRQVGA